MIIGIHGKARAGKDTISKVLVKELGMQTYSFAKPIKDACNLIFGWDERHSDGELKEVVDPRWGISPRYAYQTLGTEWGRNLIAMDMWVRRAELLFDVNTLVIPDVRFVNELEFIRKHNGVLIFVRRPCFEKAIELNTHVSEAGLEQHLLEQDITILNDGLKEDLEQKVRTEVVDIIRTRSQKAEHV